MKPRGSEKAEIVIKAMVETKANLDESGLRNTHQCFPIKRETIDGLFNERVAFDLYLDVTAVYGKPVVPHWECCIRSCRNRVLMFVLENMAN